MHSPLFLSAFALIFLTTLNACDFKSGVGKLMRSAGLLSSEVKQSVEVDSKDDQSTAAGDLAKANSELLSEMMKVVFDEKEVEDKSYFGSLVHSLNQGASLEGIYRGIIMGQRYRGLESKSQAASPMMLKAFAFQMVEIQSKMQNPTAFTKEARKAPEIDFPEGGDSPTALPPSQEVTVEKKDKKVRMEELLTLFIGASPFTLKRTLGEEALRKMDELKDSSGELADWYARTTMQLLESKIDFGLEQRNLADFDFHFKFAQKMAQDRVRWEVLNRYHRYLNAAMKK